MVLLGLQKLSDLQTQAKDFHSIKSLMKLMKRVEQVLFCAISPSQPILRTQGQSTDTQEGLLATAGPLSLSVGAPIIRTKSQTNVLPWLGTFSTGLSTHH